VRLIPGIPYGPPPRAQAVTGALAWPPPLIVVHATDNPTSTAAGEARYAATRTDAQSGWTSCHAYVDANGPLGSLPLDFRAWAAFAWANAHGIHIELCGVSGRVPLDVQRAGAALVRQLCLLTGAPMTHLDGVAIRRLHDSGGPGGVTGHGDITASRIDGNDHTDPGFTAADWARFMGWVTGGQATQSTPVAGGGKMSFLVNQGGTVYISDGINRRPSPDGPTVTRWRGMGLPEVSVSSSAELEYTAGPAPSAPATVALTAQDKADLVAGFAAAMGPIAQAAAEAAVRRVLGGLDGATPPAGG
jgi:hypothetical protein